MGHRSVTYSSRHNARAKSSETTFQALADPTRRAVLDLLRRGNQPAGQIAAAFPVSRPAISRHLRLLRRAHLVCEHREGRHRVYQLNPEPLRVVDTWIDQYRRFWAVRLSNLKTLVESEYAGESQPLRKQKRDRNV